MGRLKKEHYKKWNSFKLLLALLRAYGYWLFLLHLGENPVFIGKFGEYNCCF